MFETYLFALTLIAFFHRLVVEAKRNSILFVFVRDGTWAYAVIFGACHNYVIFSHVLIVSLSVSLLLNTLMYKLEANPLAGMGYLYVLRRYQSRCAPDYYLLISWDCSVLSFSVSLSSHAT